MITYYIDMSKNAGLDKFASELAILPTILNDSLLDENHSMILTRIIKGVSSEKWRKACKKLNLSEWHAIPARGENSEWEEELELSQGKVIPVTPFREISGIITRSMFVSLLKRELKRITRTGGALSLISAVIINRDELAKNIGRENLNRIEALLASVLLSLLDSCDSIGFLRKGQFLCCLPGIGQLVSRNIAEQAQIKFVKELPSRLAKLAGNSGIGIECALGIVNILQGDNEEVKNLLKRASLALEMAIQRTPEHIYQESSAMQLENTTLVQSSEKQFLFFGSNRP